MLPGERDREAVRADMVRALRDFGAGAAVVETMMMHLAPLLAEIEHLAVQEYVERRQAPTMQIEFIHEASHLAEALRNIGAVQALKDAADAEVALGGYTMVVERLLARAHGIEGRTVALTPPPSNEEDV